MAPKTGLYIGIGVSVGVLAIGAIIVAIILHHGNSIGDPTDATTAPGVLDKIEIPLDISTITTPAPSTGNDALAVYQSAVKDVAALGDDFALSLSDPTAVDPDKTPAFKGIMDKLESAADKGLAPSEKLDFDAILPLTPSTEWTPPRSIHDKLQGMGTLLSRRAMRLRDSDKAAALKSARAELIWGLRLFNNGPYVVYKNAGESCISEGLGLFQLAYGPDLLNDPAKLAAAKALYAIYLPAAKKWDAKDRVLRSVKPGPAAADVWNLAENDKDPAWNIEGILWLGVGQWVWADGSQRTAIQKYLEQKMSSPDPLIAKFAAAAFKTPRAGSGDFAR